MLNKQVHTGVFLKLLAAAAAIFTFMGHIQQTKLSISVAGECLKTDRRLPSTHMRYVWAYRESFVGVCRHETAVVLAACSLLSPALEHR